MVKQRLTSLEWIILVAGIILLALGFIFFYTDKPQFDEYVKEDGLVEWITVLGLLGGSIVCFRRFLKLFRQKSSWFLFITFFLALFLFFAAGEEISWGQRVISIETPEYFQKNNAQQETNLHNLVVGGVKLNKLLFSIVLVSVMGIYLVVVPLLYRWHRAGKQLIDRWGIPVPQWYQVIGFLIVFIATSLIPDGKRAELLECVGALLVFLMMLYPANKSTYNATV